MFPEQFDAGKAHVVAATFNDESLKPRAPGLLRQSARPTSLEPIEGQKEVRFTLDQFRNSLESLSA